MLKSGEDSEAAIAFLPANDAFGMMDCALLEMDSRGWLGRYGLCNVVHDAVWFHCGRELANECLHNAVGVMTAPSKVLVDPVVAPEGLWCGCEAMMGESLGKDDMRKVKV